MPDMMADGRRVLDLGKARSVALLGGIYSNYLALEAALALARERAELVVALGDFGAFGPHPDRTLEVLRSSAVPAIQGNYEESLASDADDCHCGYTDPRDNHFAQISYDYTRAKTSSEHKRWMADLPAQARVTVGNARVLLCHGSPRKINEFLWESTTSAPFVGRLLREHEADVIACTHTGLHWSRFVGRGRGIVNAGALGRPANDGTPRVWFTVLDAVEGEPRVEFVPVLYDQERIARETAEEGLPDEFARTLRTGWWTTCLEILPAKERARARF